MTTAGQEPGEPPRAALYAIYLAMFIALLTVLVIVGVYGV